jgi:hypothetical protein
MPYHSFPWKSNGLQENFCFAGIIGDCSDKQKTVNEIINETVSKTMMSNSANCSMGNGINQKILIENIETDGDINFSGLNQSADVKMNFNCLQSQGLQASDVQKIKDNIKSDLEQKASGYRFQPTEQETINKTINKISSELNLDNVSSCIANALTNQETVISKLKAKKNVNINNIAQTAITDTTAQCIQDQSGIDDKVKDLQTLFDNKMKQENKGIDIFAVLASFVNMFSNLGTTYIMVIGMVSVCCTLMCITSSFFTMGGGGSSDAVGSGGYQ